MDKKINVFASVAPLPMELYCRLLSLRPADFVLTYMYVHLTFASSPVVSHGYL